MTDATRTKTGVSCTTPRYLSFFSFITMTRYIFIIILSLPIIFVRNDLLPMIPSGESHFTSKLSVRLEKGPDFVATNFTFFDCNTYSSCTSCVSSLFPCDWCVDGKDSVDY